jgi:hypothetical protein
MSIESRKPALYKGNAPRERSTCTIKTTNSPIFFATSCGWLLGAQNVLSELARSFVWERLICDGSKFLSKLCFCRFLRASVMSVYEKAAFSNVNHLFHDQDRSCINTIQPAIPVRYTIMGSAVWHGNAATIGWI